MYNLGFILFYYLKYLILLCTNYKEKCVFVKNFLNVFTKHLLFTTFYSCGKNSETGKNKMDVQVARDKVK